jgi:hypothetical protein
MRPATGGPGRAGLGIPATEGAAAHRRYLTQQPGGQE